MQHLPACQAGRSRPPLGRRRTSQPDRQGLRDQSLQSASAPGKLPEACVVERHHEGRRAGHRGGCLPATRDELGNAYAELKLRIDRIATQAEEEGSLKVALSGLNSIRQTLDSLSRLAGHDQAQVNVAVHADINLDLVFERLITQFDHEPEIKSRIAQTLLTVDHQQVEVDHDQAA
jgi:hypothetical protein